MGNSNSQNQPLQKGEGYRIVEVQPNSPFQGKADPFFDFIVEVIPPQGERSPSEILDKLAGPTGKVGRQPSPFQIMQQNVDRTVKVKIVSTKLRKVRTINVTPNSAWSNSNDILGITVRRERFDEAFETYFPFVDIKANSPVRKAGIKEGQYLIGCAEFPYQSLDIFMEGLYQHFFDKEKKDKSVHLAIYDIGLDTLVLKEVTLSRGWGGKGLLGCEFMQGMLNKFPTNLEEQRAEILKQEAKKSEILKMRNQLGECDGASKLLVESLQSQKSKKQRHYKIIKNLLSVEPPKLSLNNQPLPPQNRSQAQQPASEPSDKDRRISQLQQRVGYLQSSFSVIKQYFQSLRQQVQMQPE